MEENNNLLQNNNNIIQENVNINNEPLINRELESDDYQIIIFNSLPSIFYWIIITIILFIPLMCINYINLSKVYFWSLILLIEFMILIDLFPIYRYNGK